MFVLLNSYSKIQTFSGFYVKFEESKVFWLDVIALLSPFFKGQILTKSNKKLLISNFFHGIYVLQKFKILIQQYLRILSYKIFTSVETLDQIKMLRYVNFAFKI
eukprot:TRINITY_DN2648_c0_g1_i8.p11 TRINITY_DN2648_c0_g1~~TRINITY_DN2648_c0_g1_i8.p11  ORF type:complete len:104 (-),score=0.61 TRINITY_DN2648_c0_g1_i8:2379-2690(-)